MFLFLDLDGTLNDQDSAERDAALVWRKEYASLIDEPEEGFLRRWQSAAGRHIGRYLNGEISYLEQSRERLREILGDRARGQPDSQIDRMFRVYIEEYARGWRMYPDGANLLERWPDRPLGLVSNGEGDEQRRKLDALGLGERFTPIVISGEVGTSKPNVGIFQESCRRLGHAPAECMYVGDQLETDAIAATRAGLIGIWLDRHCVGTPDCPVPRIESLAGLPQTIERLELLG